MEDSDIIELNVLVPRYLSADGLDLAEYASTAEEYVRLREDLKTTSKELFYNFTEYSGNKGAYLADSSNVRYCFQMNVDGESRYFTNLEENLSDLKIEEITAMFEEFGSYMYYNADRAEMTTNTGLTADEIFTNLEENLSDLKIEEITAMFEEFGSYMYYNADRAEMTTNTGLTADEMKMELGYYQYAFGDNTRIWVAVDTSYPVQDNADRAEMTTNTGLTADEMKMELGYYQYAFGDNTRIWVAVDTSYPVQDGFWTAKEAYDRLMPYYGYLAGACAVLLGLSVWIFVFLTKFEGRIFLPAGGWDIALKRCDRIPTEPFFVLGAGSAAGFAGLCYLAFVFCQGTIENVIHSVWLPFAAGAAAFVADDLCMFVYLSFVRRGKAHTLWKNSLILRGGRRLKREMLALYDNSHILVRALLPFILLLTLNLVLGGCGVAGILIAAAVDVAAILALYSSKKTRQGIVDTAVRIGRGDLDKKVDLRKLHGENRELAEAVNGIGDGIKTAVEKSMKDERLKADLITNVSHDIKTPLTSIINFVSLLKREKIENERARGYIEVLDAKSQRLKQLTDDLVEASKISSGNISLQWERLDFKELVNQTCGEFADKFQEKCLEMVVSLPEGPVCIEADSRRLWRVVENLFSNAYKYALEGTRVYLDIKRITENGQEYAVFSMKNISAQALNIRAEELTERFIRGEEGTRVYLDIKRITENGQEYAVFSMKNISAQALNIRAEELTERFIRGDISRSTEGSGLGITENGQEYAVFSMKNISAQALNIRAEELTERFIRGDISRSTEGSGLGLSIAQNLTQLQKGRFDIYLDGDLFKVMVTFPTVKAAGEE